MNNYHRTYVWVIVILVIIIVNGFLYFNNNQLNYNDNSESSELVTLFKWWNYKDLLNKNEQEINVGDRFRILSLLKLWYIDLAVDEMEKRPPNDEILIWLYRLTTLYNNEDRDTLLKVSEWVTHNDPTIRSVYLWLRAFAYMNLDMRQEAFILSQDSINLDPLSPQGTVLQWLSYFREWNRQLSDDFLKRSEDLWYNMTDELLFKRWINAYRLNNNDVSIKYLSDLVDNDKYWSRANYFLGLSYLRKNDNSSSLMHLKRSSELDSRNIQPLLKIWDIYSEMNDMENAINYYLKWLEISPNNVSLLSHSLISLYNLWMNKDFDSTVNLLEFLTQDNSYASAIFLGRLRKIKQFEVSKTLLNSKIILADLDDDKFLHNEVIRHKIWYMINFGEISEDSEWLLAYNWWDLKDRKFYISLIYSLQSDLPTALRALQELDFEATPKDVQTITLLHHILMKDMPAAAALLQSRERQEPLDLDYLRLTRRLAEMAGEAGETIEGEAQAKLLLLENISDADADADDMLTGFDKHFNERLKYMKQYYPE